MSSVRRSSDFHTADHRAFSLRTPELLLLTLLAALTRFWDLFTPSAVVFDERWSEIFAGDYLAHTFYVDVHPPLARLLIAGSAWLAGIAPETLAAPEPAVVLRLLPALCGTLIVPLVYIILRRLDASRRVATLGAAFVLLDNALLVEARFILPESILICFGLVAVALFLDARRRLGAGRWTFLALAAFFAGCALSVKWTGASALALIGAAWLFDGIKARHPAGRMVAEGVVLVAIPIAVYAIAFAIHFTLLTHTGGPIDTVMSDRFQSTLIGNAHYDPRAELSFAAKFVETQRAMMRANNALMAAANVGSSRWYTWPIMKHPISYWVADVAQPEMGVVFLLGNPLVWFGSLIASLAGLVLFARQRARWARREYALAFLAGGYLINFAPFAAIQRLMFLYHYLFALVFVAMLGALSLGALAGWSSNEGGRFTFASRRSAAVYWGLLCLVAMSFLYFSPLSYGARMSAESFDFHLWLLHPGL